LLLAFSQQEAGFPFCPWLKGAWRWMDGIPSYQWRMMEENDGDSSYLIYLIYIYIYM
jgi:hypothetical protein